MLFWRKTKSDLSFLTELYMQKVDVQASMIEKLEARLERLEAAPHGFKKDGTPRAKPGRKVGS
jgi:hypothetical protein